MKNAKDNLIVQETFSSMCKLLKDQEGIYHREIAEDIEIDTSLLSRWLNGNHRISKFYNNRIYAYLKQSRFEYLSEPLKQSIIQRLRPNPKGRIYHNVVSFNYANLLQYLFNESTTVALEREDQLKYIFFDMTKNTLIRKTMDKKEIGGKLTVLKDIYSDISPEVRKECEKLQITNLNTMIIDLKSDLKSIRKILVLFGHNYFAPSVDAKLEFFMKEHDCDRFDQYIMITNPWDYIIQSYECFEYHPSTPSGSKAEAQTAFVDIENINFTKLERYVDFLVGKILDTISECEYLSSSNAFLTGIAK